MIATFYSYKDGVGRTMALANIGELLREAGLRVLLVDLDLQGPSLDRYFWNHHPPGVQRGFIDLVAAYKEALIDPGWPARARASGSVLDFESFLSTFPREQSSGQLCVMSTGRVDEGYAAQVQEFDWRDFYARWEGELFFRWFHGQCEQRFDVTLVDVRAGHTPMGSIACYQVADAVVCFCGPRPREMQGLSAMVEGFLQPTVFEKRGSSVHVLVVPSRIDDRFEMSQVERIAALFRSSFAPFAPEAVPIETSWDARIPEIAFYAQQDAALVDAKRTRGLSEAYRRVAALICRLAPSSSRLAGVHDAVRDRA
jgi:cellulose biosynthesis protein BcsQ